MNIIKAAIVCSDNKYINEIKLDIQNSLTKKICNKEKTQRFLSLIQYLTIKNDTRKHKINEIFDDVKIKGNK